MFGLRLSIQEVQTRLSPFSHIVPTLHFVINCIRPLATASKDAIMFFVCGLECEIQFTMRNARYDFAGGTGYRASSARVHRLRVCRSVRSGDDE